MNIFSLVQTALELGLICSLTVLALFLSYSMLNVCDLSTDGCFTLGAAVGAMVAIAGHPYLALLPQQFALAAAGFSSDDQDFFFLALYSFHLFQKFFHLTHVYRPPFICFDFPLLISCYSPP